MLAVLALALALDTGLAIVPRPVRFTPRTGTYTLTATTVIVTDRGTRRAFASQCGRRLPRVRV